MVRVLKKSSVFCLTFCLIMLLYVSFISAFAMSPAAFKFEYDSDKGVQEEIRIGIISRSRETIFLTASLRDDLLEYASLRNNELTLKPGESGFFVVDLNVPPGLDLVGTNELRATVQKKAPDDVTGFMRVTTALRARIQVVFAYPGQYVTITGLGAKSINQGGVTDINWEVQGRGTEVTTFEAELLIKNVDDELVFSKNYPSMKLEMNQKHSEKLSVDASTFLPGVYSVSLTATSTNVATRTTTFRIGKEDVELVSFVPENFTEGEIVEFTAVFENAWNGKFNAVYAELNLGDKKAITRTASLAEFGSLELSQFIDLRHLEVGSYEGVLKVFFDGNSKEFDVVMNSVPRRVESSKLGLFIVLGVVLLLVLFFLFVLFKRANRKRKRTKHEEDF